jgi:anhydro-N-acetylmuramic acid kinase
MSGTSVDGVDAAVVAVESETVVKVLGFASRPYATAEREQILTAIGTGTARELALLHRRLGLWFAEAASDALARCGLRPGDVSLVASHGQTVWHEPGYVSLQLGCSATIAERLGVPVVSDFRSRDVAAGGQGAPLVPIADAMLFGAAEAPRVLLNIGGMANATWVPRRGRLDGVLAFDTGPGVAVIDAVTRQLLPDLPFDVDGRGAARGTPCEAVLDRRLAGEYFSAPPPKSTGRETVGARYAQQLVADVRREQPLASDDDCIATALELTVRSIAGQIRTWLPGAERADVVVSGGGARNPTLMRRLGAELGAGRLRRFDELFFDGDAKEAVVFAYLGWRTREGLPGNVPSATGATGPRVLGAVTAS